MSRETELRQAAEQMFFDAANKIWGVPTVNRLIFRPTSIRNSDVFIAAVEYAPPVRAVGKVIRKAAAWYRLVVTPLVLKCPREVVQAVMTHEAIHLGYTRHDFGFRTLAREFGAPVAE